MDTSEIRKEAERLWNSRDNQKLFDYLYENRKEIVEVDTDLGYTYFLSAVDNENIEKYGRHGILYSGQSLPGSLKNISSLKKIIQRIEWCEETDPASIISAMNKYGATAQDLKWLVGSSAYDPEYVFARITGKAEKNAQRPPQPEYYDADLSSEGSSVDFIICSNDETELAETEYYINRLYIPAGCTVNTLAIIDAKSICSGYNEAMDASSSKYKVYLHHDVRIIDRYFIYYLLKLFHDDPDLGIVGMIGPKSIPEDGIMWNNDRYGAWMEGHVNKCVSISRYPSPATTEVAMADGFLLATGTDIRWREDLFDGWDFYDASQCLEYRKRGMKVVVPYQSFPWCLHDCGYMNLSKHGKYRQVFLDNYLN